MNKEINIVIAGRDKAAIQTLEGMISGPMRRINMRHISNGHADPLHDLPEIPDLLIFHAGTSGAVELECLIERPADQRPPALIIGPANDVRLVRLAMKAGACDYLADPVDRDELLTSLDQIETDIRHGADGRQGKLIAVVGAKGGSGASFISANLAHILCARVGYRTAMMDLDIQFGCLGQYLDLASQHNMRQVLEMTEDLDSVALDAYMVKHHSGLSLLGPAADEFILPGEFPADRLGGLLDLLRANYDRSIIDMPRQIDEISATVYERADHIVIITQQDVANIRDANRLRQILICELAVPADHVTLVINRFDKNSPVEKADVCRSVGISEDSVSVIPNHFRDVAESVNVGVPMLDHARNSAVTKGLIGLADRFSDYTGEQTKNIISRAFSNFLGG